MYDTEKLFMDDEWQCGMDDYLIKLCGKIL